MKLCENLSRHQRSLTPWQFAKCLVGLMASIFGPETMVAALFTHRGTPYWKFSNVEIWGLDLFRDATGYRGPWPIIAHPYCGPWGKYKANCNQPKEHGIIAMELVHEFGGIVEHPLGSSLFKEHGRDEAIVLRVNQGDHGHLALKPTLLYIVPRPKRTKGKTS